MFFLFISAGKVIFLLYALLPRQQQYLNYVLHSDKGIFSPFFENTGSAVEAKGFSMLPDRSLNYLHSWGEELLLMCFYI